MNIKGLMGIGKAFKAIGRSLNLVAEAGSYTAIGSLKSVKNVGNAAMYVKSNLNSPAYKMGHAIGTGISKLGSRVTPDMKKLNLSWIGANKAAKISEEVGEGINKTTKNTNQAKKILSPMAKNVIANVATLAIPTLISAGLSGFGQAQSVRSQAYGNAYTPPGQGIKTFGPAYETAAMQYSLNANMQGRGQTPMQQSTEGLSLALHNLKHRGFL